MGEVINIPELRFPEFNGEWKNNTLGGIATFSKGKGVSKADISVNGKLGCIRYGELYTDYSEVIDTVISKTNIDGIELVLSEQNDVIIPASGETQIDIATASCVMKSGVALGGDLNIIKSPSNGIFLAYYLNNKKKYDIARFAQGISVVHLYSSQLKLLKLQLPSISEQTKIANLLTTVDERINLLTKQKEKLELYKKGVMQQIFSQQLRFKDDDGNAFPDWEEKRLGEIGVIVSGLTYSPNDIDEKGTLVLRSSNIQNRSLTFDDNVYVLTQKYNPVQEDDILICVRNGSQRLIGKNAIIKKTHEGMAFGAFMSVFRSPNNSFIFHFFDTEAYYKNVYRNLGATINSINGSELKQFKIPFPCKQEQKKIASFLSSIDKKIELVTQQIEQTKTWKKGLLQKMFV